MLQSMLLSARGWGRGVLREGAQFRAVRDEIDASQWLSPDDLSKFQDRRLRDLLTCAQENVPFYKRVHATKRCDFASARDMLFSFPLIDKKVVREEGECLVSFLAKKPLIEINTSGTSGTPITLRQDLSAINRENAFIRRQLTWAGFKDGDRRAWLRGDMVVPASQTTPPFWRYSSSERMLFMSSYHLSDRTARAYLDALRSFDPVIVHAYPSSVGFLARMLEDTGAEYEGTSLKAVVTSSETLAPEQRKNIEERFRCKIYDWYGQSERVAAIGTCEHGAYHVISDYGYVEFLPAQEGFFEIVGTAYNNAAMPLIRYRTGDYVELDGCDKCACGRAFPRVKRVIGRCDDYVKTPDGRRVGRLDHIFKGADHLLEAQIVQETLDEIILRVVPSPDYETTTGDLLIRNAQNLLGDLVRIRVERVDHIERTSNGKFRNVICNV